MGFCGRKTSYHKPNQLAFERKSREIWSLEVHRIKIVKFGVCKNLDVEIIRVITFFLSHEDFSNSYWIYIPNIKDFTHKKNLPFFFGDNRMFFLGSHLVLTTSRNLLFKGAFTPNVKWKSRWHLKWHPMLYGWLFNIKWILT